jgi:hypothetical protein
LQAHAEELNEILKTMQTDEDIARNNHNAGEEEAEKKVCSNRLANFWKPYSKSSIE